MRKYEALKNRISTMTIKEIVMTMVHSLREPVTEIDMSNFGRLKDNVCYGCAATNFICKVGGLDPKEELRPIYPPQYDDIGDNPHSGFMRCFENAIDSLREGKLDRYNYYAKQISIAVIPEILTYKLLPPLSSELRPKDLQEYEDFANKYL